MATPAQTRWSMPHAPHGPFSRGGEVTPDDNNDLPEVSSALWVGTGGGDVAVTLVGGFTLTLTAVPAGTILKLRVSRVKATGTTATSIAWLA